MRAHPGPVVAVAVLVMVLTACEGGDDGSSAAPEPQPATTTSPTPPSIPLEDGPRLEPGTYSVSSEGRTGSDPLLWSIVDYTITIPEGWKGHTGHYLSKYEGFDEAAGLASTQCWSTRSTPIRARVNVARSQAAGPKVNDLVDALLAQPGTATTEPVQTTIGGLPATRIDLEVRKGADLRSCFLADFGRPGLQIWFSKPTQTVLRPHARLHREHLRRGRGRRAPGVPDAARASSFRRGPPGAPVHAGLHPHRLSHRAGLELGPPAESASSSRTRLRYPVARMTDSRRRIPVRRLQR